MSVFLRRKFHIIFPVPRPQINAGMMGKLYFYPFKLQLPGGIDIASLQHAGVRRRIKKKSHSFCRNMPIAGDGFLRLPVQILRRNMQRLQDPAGSAGCGKCQPAFPSPFINGGAADLPQNQKLAETPCFHGLPAQFAFLIRHIVKTENIHADSAVIAAGYGILVSKNRPLFVPFGDHHRKRGVGLSVKQRIRSVFLRRSRFQKPFVMFPCHPHIQIVIPGDKPFMAYRSQKRTAAAEVLDLSLLTEPMKILQDGKLCLLKFF